MNITDENVQPSEEEMKVYMEQWNKWINEISSSGQLSEGGNHFSKNGRVIKSNGAIENNAYTADRISVAGYILITAEDFDGALKIAGRCPILGGENTSVEIRELSTPG